MDHPSNDALALFPASAERMRVRASLSAALEAARVRVAHGAVTRRFDLAGFRADLAGFDFEAPRALEDVLAWAMASLEGGIVHVTHPRYFGLFNPAPSFPAECAEQMVACFNPQLATSRTSPAAVEIEAHVIAQVAHRAGLPSGAGGHFTNAGAEANHTALLCALAHADDRYVRMGVRAFDAHPIVYISADAHLAWYKAALQAGLGHDATRAIPTDGNGRLDTVLLARTIAADRAVGGRPVMIAATAGTTNAGMIDPLAECNRIARMHGAWFHVDAAWGGALIASPARRGVLAGIESADSITIDAHKWFATTMSCGMLLLRAPAALGSIFGVSANFMPSGNGDRDPYLTSVQWSRRFLGLRMFLALAAAGWSGFAAHVEHAIGLAALLAEALRGRGWRIVNQSPVSVLSVVPPAGFPSVEALARAIVASGGAWISTAMFEGQQVLRVCITNGQTTEEDVMALVHLLEGLRPKDGATAMETCSRELHA